MARDFNQNRNTNAKLGSGRVSGYGNHWSLVDELDGWNKVFVETPNLPSNIKEYLEGNTTLSVYATPQNIDKLHQYAFAGFPNLVDLYLLKEEEIVELDDNFLGGVSSLQHIYVPIDLLGDSSIQDTYLGKYNGKTFASLFTAIPSVLEWTITTSEIGSDTLTEQNFNVYISTLTDRIKNAVGQLNFNGFTNGVDFAWSYDFSNVFPSLEDIYVDNAKVDFSTWTIEGSGTLTSEIVENAIANISSSKLSGINKLVIDSGFTAIDNNSLDVIDTSDLPSHLTLVINSPAQNTFGSMYSNTNTKIENIIDNRTTLPQSAYANLPSSLKNIHIENATTLPNYFMFRRDATNKQLVNLYANKITSIGGNYTFTFTNAYTDVVELRELVNMSNSVDVKNSNYIYVDKLKSIGFSAQFGGSSRTTFCHWYIGTSDCTTSWSYGGMFITKQNFYFKAEYLINYVNGTNSGWSDWQNNGRVIGYLDYTDTIPTFTGYTDTWYTDEDTTIPINPQDFVSGNRYYVKLTSI